MCEGLGRSMSLPSDEDEHLHTTRQARSHADSGLRINSWTLEFDYMRHLVGRLDWQAWVDIGAGRMIVDMIRNGVRLPLKNGPPAPFEQGVSMEDATTDQIRFTDNDGAGSLPGQRSERDLSFETLTRLRHMAWPGDDMLFMDLHDGFYAVGIAPEDRDYSTVDCRGKLIYRLVGLPMGWSLSPHY
eukprot:jgi/Tetstr1/463026/TSEL_007964.t1